MNAVATLEANLTWAEKIAFLAHRLKSVALDNDKDMPVTHSFEPGTYVREMVIPAGVVFIGRAHRHGHRCALISGSILLMSEAGEEAIDAPFEIHTAPGYQMVLRTITDVVGRTYHPNPTESRDLVALEAEAFHPAEEVFKLGHDVNCRVEEAMLCLAQF